MNKTVKYIILSLVLFGISTGISYSFFHFLGPRSPGTNPVSPVANTTTTPAPRKLKVDPSLPKTAVCPLNGALFTQLEKDVWSTRRPLAVMIENSVDARPQSGLGFADIVYEAVAEGGITRFMGMFYCDAALTDNLMIAPVRSARIYYVNLLSEYDALYNHVGGAGNCDDANVDPRAKALCLIDNAKIKNLDQMGYAGDFKVCHRVADRLGRDVAYEHTMACFVDGLYTKADKLKWGYTDEKGVAWDKNFVSWKFMAPGDVVTGDPATSISYMFWTGNRDFNKNYDESWAYNQTTKSYVRSNAGVVSTDLTTKQQLEFKTVIVQYTKETILKDKESHLLYDVVGKGDALVFIEGQAVKATWSKTTRLSRTIYKDLKGVELKLNPGPIWITILPLGNTVTYN